MISGSAVFPSVVKSEPDALRTVIPASIVRLAPVPVGRTRTSFSSIRLPWPGALAPALNNSTTPLPRSVCAPPEKFRPTSRLSVALFVVRSKRRRMLLASVRLFSTVTWLPTLIEPLPSRIVVLIPNVTPLSVLPPPVICKVPIPTSCTFTNVALFNVALALICAVLVTLKVPPVNVIASLLTRLLIDTLEGTAIVGLLAGTSITTSSLTAGSESVFQLRGSFQLVPLPPPSQVIVARTRRTSKRSKHKRRRRPR